MAPQTPQTPNRKLSVGSLWSPDGAPVELIDVDSRQPGGVWGYQQALPDDQVPLGFGFALLESPFGDPKGFYGALWGSIGAPVKNMENCSCVFLNHFC